MSYEVKVQSRPFIADALQNPVSVLELLPLFISTTSLCVYV